MERLEEEILKLKEYTSKFCEEVCFVSAKTGQGIQELEDKMNFDGLFVLKKPLLWRWFL